MINPIWFAPAFAFLAYAYFRTDDIKFWIEHKAFWDKQLSTVSHSDTQRFMAYKPLSKGQKRSGLPSAQKLDFKTRVFNAVRECLTDMSYLDDSNLFKHSKYKAYFRIDNMEVHFWLANSVESRAVTEIVYNNKSFGEKELYYVNDLLSDKEKQTIQSFKEYLTMKE